MLAALNSERSTVVIDFRWVTFIDAAVVGVLLTCRRRAVATGGTLRVANARGSPATVLAVTGAAAALCGPPTSPRARDPGHLQIVRERALHLADQERHTVVASRGGSATGATGVAPRSARVARRRAQ